MIEIPATIDLNPVGNAPDASIIWLHGLGADGNDFVPIVEQLGLENNHRIRFVFPNAPLKSITVNGGMEMRAWYDIAEINLSHKEDVVGIQDSTKILQLLIEREESLGISNQKIILAGFSQGGAMALYAGLRFSKKLAGIIALSTYLPLANDFKLHRHPANQETPIFMAHGLFDPIVPLMMGEMSRQQLLGLGYSVEWHAYSMAHSVVSEEIKDIGNFVNKNLCQLPNPA